MAGTIRSKGDGAEPAPAGPGKAISAIARRRQQAANERNPSWLERRTQILAAAAEVFRAKGYRATAVSDIAARLESDRANMYYYFADKAEIYLTLVRPAVDDILAQADGAAADPGTPTERLVQVIESLAESYHRHYPYLQLIVQEDLRWVAEDSPVVANALRQAAERYDAALARIAEAGVASGDFRPGIDPRMLRLAVLGAVNWTHRWFSPDGALSGREIGRAFSDIFVRGIAARAGEA